MTTAFVRLMLTFLIGMILILGVLSCSKTETARFQPPAFLPDETATQIYDLINQGYAQLDSARLTEAVAAFAQVSRLIPNGLVGEYYTACAYALTGDKEQAFTYLTKMVDSGYDNPEQLDNDGDFESLKSDARFEPLIARALENFSKSSAALAAGMPEYAAPPRQFTTEEELNTWVEDQTRKFRAQYRFWRAGDALLAQIDFAARRLSCLRELKKSDTAFDYGLERIRALARLKSPYEAGWGVVSDLVVKETDSYLRSNPSPVGQSEANYQAAFALSLQHAAQDNRRAESFRQAADRLAKVPEGSPYYGAALALTAINKLRSPNADVNAAGQELKSAIERFPGDAKLARVIQTQANNQAARYLWPIQLEKPDIDNTNVSLANYTGKVLLIDFWATWCPPCRAELPNVLQVYKEYHPKGLEIVSISLDYAEEVTPEAYRHWIDSAGMNWRHVYDGQAWDTEMVKRFFIGSIPAPFLVGKDGALVAWGDDLHGESLAPTVRSALGI